MRKLIIACIILCSAISLRAQMSVGQATFKGETYKVYPVRFEYNPYDEYFAWDRRARTNLLKKASEKKLMKHQEQVLQEGFSIAYMEKKLQYNPFALPDGKYLAYYVKIPYDISDRGEEIYRDEDKVRVAATFTVVSNLLEGEATWYDFFDQDLVIQKSSYAKGLKDGQWQTTFGSTSNSYRYTLDTLEGDYARVFGKKVQEEGEFKSNEKVRINFYNKGKLRYEKTGEKGLEIEYFKNGQQREIRNNSDTATFLQKKYYQSGHLEEMVKVHLKDSLQKVYRYDDNGKLTAEIIQGLEPSLNRYHGNGLTLMEMVIKNLPITFYTSDVKAIKLFNESGVVTFSYQLEDSNRQIINMTDSKGKPPVKLYFANDSLLVEETWDNEIHTVSSYLPKQFFLPTAEPQYFEVLEEVYSGNELLSINYSDDGYLNSLYKDSLGFVRSKYFKTKKMVNETFRLLHSNYSRDVMTYKKAVLNEGQFEYKVQMNESDTTLWLSRKEYSKDGMFHVKHEATMPYHKVVKNPYNHRSEIRELDKKIRAWEKSSLFEEPDTVLYKVYYNNELITGDLYLTKKRRRLKEDFGKVKVQERWNGRNRYEVPKRDWDWADYYITLKNGVPDGELKEEYNKHCFYHNGLKEGSQKTSYESGFYSKGQKHGRFTTGSKVMEYNRNTLVGEYIETGIYYNDNDDNEQVNMRAHYVDGVLQGKLQRYVYPYTTYEDANFENGILQGDYSSGSESFNKMLDVRFKDGQLIDTGRYYFKEGNIKCKVNYAMEDGVLPAKEHSTWSYIMHDSLRHDSVAWKKYVEEFYAAKAQKILPENSYSGSRSREIFYHFNPELTGDYTYYYKSGVVSMVGRVEKGAKIGVWKYFDVNGGLYKQVEYDTGQYIIPNTGDTISYYATITSYHPNGKLLLKGLVKDQKSRYKCEIEQSISMEEVHYLEFYDLAGNQLISDQGGYVYQYYNDGTKSVEGSYFNGKRDGLWKFYDPDGMLEEVGEYVDGEKNGIWYKGDLQGVPYFDNACMLGAISDEPNVVPATADMIKKRISIQRIYYIDDVEIENDGMTLYPL